MKEILHLLLLIAASMVSINAFNRETLINAAIEDANQEKISTKQFSATKESHDGTTSSDLLHAFKRASKQAIQQGNARIRFENLIHRAERNILENERLEMKDATNLAKAEEIAKILVSKPGSVLTKDEIAKIYQEEECPEVPPVDCEEPSLQMMRSVTGVCNNIEKPYLGSSGTPFRRLIPQQYEDGFNHLRGTMQSEENSLLNGQPGPFQPPNPSPRVISINVVQDLLIFNDMTTHLLMQWGQFVDHDLDLAPAFAEKCDPGCDITEKCVPIRVASSDPTFGMQGPTREDICLPFPRSIPACDLEAAEGKLRPREQINELTSFIDASQVYGSNEDLFNAVRDPTSGRLRTGSRIPAGSGGDSLPIDENSPTLVECLGTTDCFLAGDVRVNEQTSLIVMHTLWMREHNRIVDELMNANPGFGDRYNENIFQTARAIVGAEIQKITFKDYLPVLLGSAMSLIKPYSGYNSSVDPSVPNAFAAAAFRFGHTQINNVFDRLDKNNDPLESIGPLNLLDAFFNPSQYSTSLGTDPLLRGLLQRPARSVDEFVNDILTNHLFQTSTSQGMDLAALNIQRGRDHGLPPYLTWKRWAQQECKMSSDFINDLTEVRLLQTYGTLETVDLWVGGLAETHVPGGLLGATFACIFAKTFEAIRDGDRFYYENPDSPLFTDAQRNAIDDASLSRIICDNADDIDNIQANAFMAVSSPENPVVSCTSLPAVDLGQWDVVADANCYLRARVLRRKGGSTTLTTTSQLRPQREQYENVLTADMDTACLRIICPTETKSVKVTVSSNSKQCQAQRSRLLRRIQGNRSLRGKISNADIENPNNGAYRGLTACNEGTRNEVIFNCGKYEEQNENLLEELEASLIQSTSSISSEAIRIPNVDFSKMPEEIREFFLEDEENESDASEQSWRKETINTLENLLSNLKAEQDIAAKNGHENEDNVATDQELYKSLKSILKNTK